MDKIRSYLTKFYLSENVQSMPIQIGWINHTEKWTEKTLFF